MFSYFCVFIFFRQHTTRYSKKTLENSLRFPAIASHQMESYTHDFSSRSPSQISRGVGFGLSIASFPSRRGIRKLYATSQQQTAERKGTKSWLVLGWRKKREQEEDCQQSARQRPKAFTEFNELSVHTSSPYFFFYASLLWENFQCVAGRFSCVQSSSSSSLLRNRFFYLDTSRPEMGHMKTTAGLIYVSLCFGKCFPALCDCLCVRMLCGVMNGGDILCFMMSLSLFSLCRSPRSLNRSIHQLFECRLCGWLRKKVSPRFSSSHSKN